MSRTRVLSLVIGVVALVGTTTGIVLAAADSNPGNSPLALHGKTPTTAALTMSMGSGDGVAITGVMNVDFVHGRVDGTINIPVAIVMARLNIRAVNGKVYLGSSAFRSMAKADWLSASMGKIDLTGLALEMAKPEFDLLQQGLGQPTITHEGDITVRTYDPNIPALATSGLSGLANQPTLEFRTGPEGQVESLTVTTGVGKKAYTLTLSVASYNNPVTITAPKPSTVKPLTSDVLGQVSASNPLLKQLLSSATGLTTSL